MRIIAVTNQKGGCGKTTTAINVAAALAQRGQRVLLVDLDPQAHATLGLGHAPEAERPHLYHVLSDATSPRLHVADIVLPTQTERLQLAPGHILLSTLEQELVGQEGGITRLQERLQWAHEGGGWDMVIIDTPPSLGFLTFNALRAATEIIVPIETSTYALSGVAKLQSMLDLVRVKTNHRYDAVTALVTLYDERSRYARQTLGLIRSTFQHKVFTTLIRYSVQFREAASAGQSLITHDPAARGTQSYLALADEILQHDPAKPAALAPEQFFQDVRALARRVSVDLHLPSAQRVHIAGEFNQWKLTPNTALTSTPDGRWQAELDLPPGRYRYKFVVDGQWIEDPANPHRAANAFGTTDSLLIVE